jgi:hypothetical protein
MCGAREYPREKARSMRVERQLKIDELAERLALHEARFTTGCAIRRSQGRGWVGEWPEAARRKRECCDAAEVSVEPTGMDGPATLRVAVD